MGQFTQDSLVSATTSASGGQCSQVHRLGLDPHFHSLPESPHLAAMPEPVERDTLSFQSL